MQNPSICPAMQTRKLDATSCCSEAMFNNEVSTANSLLSASIAVASSALGGTQEGAHPTLLGQLAHPGAGEHHRMETQACVEMLRLLGGERAEEDGLVAGVA